MAAPLTTAAVSWSFSAAGWFVAPVLSRMLNQCFDALGMDIDIMRSADILAKLDKLETTILPQLLILTDAAEKSNHRPILGRWLQKLKSAYYEVENALGLVEYERLEKKVNSLFPSKSNIEKIVEILPEQLGKTANSLFPSTSNSTIEKITEMLPEQLTDSLFPSTSKSVIENVKEILPELSSGKKHLIKSLKSLEDAVDEAMKLVPILNLPTRSYVNDPNEKPYGQYRKTISTPGSKVIGRDKDRDEIVKLLRENPSESTSYASCYSVIGIWGMGGLGKTTLAQYVCEHEKEAKYFDCILWAHVSEDFCVFAIWKKILESASKEACPSFNDLEGLQSKLQDKLRGQKFLLVLDDVWCDKNVSEEELEQLFAPLRAGKSGSKILVTTRIEGAAKALGDMNPIPLRELDDEQFFSLFMIDALGNAQIRDKRLNEKLTKIGKQIASKLYRSPLAAKTVAGQLRIRLNPDFWLHMLESSLLKDTMGALLLSYQHLPPSLQRCFAFCSLFPKGHHFHGDDLVNLWIAEGFIETGNGDEHMKDIANWNILELISSSFFQIGKYKNGYYLHDLMHDLAQYVSKGEFLKIDSDEKKEIPAHTRHIFIVDYMFGEYVDKICKLKDLCTLIVSRTYSDFSLKKVNLDTLFTKLRKLRVLKIEGRYFKRVPKSVVHLRNLRYLEIEEVKEDRNFNSLNKLYQLRTLHTDSQIPPHVGRLISLQHFENFYVRKKMGFELKQLEHLKDLHGSLNIYGLDVVDSKEEAERAKLSEKKNLCRLYYQWNTGNGDALRENDAQILDGLCPPPQIKDLVIEGYSGKRFPSWILENSNNIIHLEHLQLANCQFLETLPKMNELSDLLFLEICHLPRLKSWEPLPSNVTKLRLYDLFSLSFVLNEDLEKIMATRSMQISQLVTFLESSKTGLYDSFNFQTFCVLEMMKMEDHVDEQALVMISKDMRYCIEKRLELICHLTNAYELYLPPVLEEITIRSCCLTDKVLAVSFRNLNSLTLLYLEDIMTMTCITNDVLSSLTSLIFLTIRECLLLTSIGGWDTHNTLEKLQIDHCPSLILKASVAANSWGTAKLIPSSCRKKNGSSVLKYVSLQKCIPADDVFENLNSIETLIVTDCPTIVNLHIGSLVSLVSLELTDCPNLTSLRGLSKINGLKKWEITGCPKFVVCWRNLLSTDILSLGPLTC